MYNREELPERTNITLESFDMANMGGDAVALATQCVFCIAIMIGIETGAFIKLAGYIKKCENKKMRVETEQTIDEARNESELYQ